MPRPKKQIVDGNLECSKCREWKPIDEFEKKSNTSVGRTSRCRKCSGRVQPPGVRGRRPIVPVDGQLQCRICRDWKPLARFEKHAGSAFGRTSRCHDCGIARCSKFDSKTPRNFLARLARNLRRTSTQRSKRSADTFRKDMLDPDLLMELFDAQDGRCAVSGELMTHVVSTDRTWTNISIDRKDSTKGYEPGNVQLVCAAVNLMKGEMTDDDLRFWAERITNSLSLQV